MKAVIFGILTAFCLLAVPVCVIWAMVDFIIYLVKDFHPFNWWSLILAGVFTVLFFVCLLYTVYYSEQYDQEILKKVDDRDSILPKSKFQSRMDNLRNQHFN